MLVSILFLFLLQWNSFVFYLLFSHVFFCLPLNMLTRLSYDVRLRTKIYDDWKWVWEWEKRTIVKKVAAILTRAHIFDAREIVWVRRTPFTFALQWDKLTFVVQTRNERHNILHLFGIHKCNRNSSDLFGMNTFRLESNIFQAFTICVCCSHVYFSLSFVILWMQKNVFFLTLSLDFWLSSILFAFGFSFYLSIQC